MDLVDLYSRSNGIQKENSAIALREYIPRMSWSCEEAAGTQAAALDVGSGTGDLTAQLLLPLLPDSVRLLVGADVSADMVRHAAAAASSIPRLRFLQTDIATPDISATPLGQQADALGGFCKVFSFYTIHWVQDQRTALSNIHSLLRPGGEGLLVFVAKAPLYIAYKMLSKQPRWSQYMTDVESLVSPYQDSADPVKDFSSALKRARFEVLTCRLRFVSHQFSPESLRDTLTAIDPFLKRVPEEEKFQHMSATLQELKKEEARFLAANAKDIDANNNFSCYLLVAHIKKGLDVM